MLSLIYPVVSTVLPLVPDESVSPRLQILDTGMMNYFLGIQLEMPNTPDLNQVHRGIIIEHLVGQEILASQSNILSRLDFWTREKRSSTALQLTKVTTPGGKSFSLLNLPYYLASQTKEYISWLKTEGRHRRNPSPLP